MVDARTVDRGRGTADLGDAPGVPQPALYDELAGIAGRAVMMPLYDMYNARGDCQEGSQ